jgi:hypothetical protein
VRGVHVRAHLTGVYPSTGASRHTVPANGILLERAPFNLPVAREKAGIDLEALVAYLRRSNLGGTALR